MPEKRHMPARSIATTRRTLAALATLVMALGLLVVATPAGHAAGQHQNGAAHLSWNFGRSPLRAWNVDQVIAVKQRATATYWSMSFTFTGTGRGGYLGLQTNGTRTSGSVGDTAIFSLWGANGARRGACQKFGGEGTGYSCRRAFGFATNTDYRLRVWRLESDARGQWWGAWIRSGRTGVDYHLGDIRVPANSRTIESVTNFSEYFGRQVACDRVPQSQAYFTQPAANFLGSRYGYYSRFDSLYVLSCARGANTRSTQFLSMPAQLLTL